MGAVNDSKITTKLNVINYNHASPTPTPKPRLKENTSYYYLLDNDYEEKNNTMVKHKPISEYDRVKHHGMLDSGTTEHFMAVQAQVKNTVPTTNKINAIITDGTNMQSTHECEIDWPKLPLNARQAHIIPKLAQQSLLSVVKLCAAGCKGIF